MIATLGIDPHHLIQSVGTLGLFAVVFAESGLLIGFFLPGDSLLFTAGLLAATTSLVAPLPLLVLGCTIAAIAGDQVGYGLGHRFGRRIFERPDSRLFKRDHLTRAEAFFERHGNTTIVLARFVPIVRTFAPVVAGASRMNHRRFTIYNVVGGTLWATGVLLLGWALGRRFPNIGDSLDLVIVVIVALSVIPLGVEFLRHRRARVGPDSVD
ncbi:MAG: VTT domain-containing protein [Acidimicrobiia bacterium]